MPVFVFDFVDRHTRGGIEGEYRFYTYCWTYKQNSILEGNFYSCWQRPKVFVSEHSPIVIGHVGRKHAIVAKSSSLTY